MVKLPGLILSSLFVSLLINVPGHAATLFYSGDAGADSTYPLGLPNQSSARYPVKEFDNFTVTDGNGWQVDSVYSNNYVTIPSFDPQTNPKAFPTAYISQNPDIDFTAFPITANWSIRSGVSSNGLGDLIASGSSVANVTSTGRTSGTGREYTFSVSGLNVSLDPGDYFLSVTPSSLNSGKLSGGYDTYASITNGLNAIGSNAADNSSFSYLSYSSYDPASNTSSQVSFINANSGDLSFGLMGDIRGIQGESTAVPEPLPAPWLVGMLPLGFGLLKGKISALRSRAKSKVN
jgi:hypothetical protein